MSHTGVYESPKSTEESLAEAEAGMGREPAFLTLPHVVLRVVGHASSRVSLEVPAFSFTWDPADTEDATWNMTLEAPGS